MLTDRAQFYYLSSRIETSDYYLQKLLWRFLFSVYRRLARSLGLESCHSPSPAHPFPHSSARLKIKIVVNSFGRREIGKINHVVLIWTLSNSE